MLMPVVYLCLWHFCFLFVVLCVYLYFLHMVNIYIYICYYYTHSLCCKCCSVCWEKTTRCEHPFVRLASRGPVAQTINAVIEMGSPGIKPSALPFWGCDLVGSIPSASRTLKSVMCLLSAFLTSYEFRKCVLKVKPWTI